MAVGLTSPASLLPITGVRLSAAAAGIARTDRDDLCLMEIESGSHCAAVFTQNAFCAAPVIVSRMHLAAASPRYLLINSGNANCGTGESGLRDAIACCEAIAARVGCQSEQVLPFSTGVIGEALPLAKMQSVFPDLVRGLSGDAWDAAARAIMTTDTLPKGLSRKINTASGDYTLTGICKGSGMIKPNMATLLAFLATDVRLDPSILQPSLAGAVARSFNRISVDGDTSTNDACVLIATGKSDARIMSMDTHDYEIFGTALNELCEELAQSLIRDAEGATKFVTICVEGAHDEPEGAQVAYAIAHSPLVKTALFASDPNWGRILAAIGRAGLRNLDINKVEIHLNDVCIVTAGARADTYTEAAGQSVMNQEEITIRVVLGRGGESVTVWTSDLSHDYVRINAEYRS